MCYTASMSWDIARDTVMINPLHFAQFGLNILHMVYFFIFQLTLKNTLVQKFGRFLDSRSGMHCHLQLVWFHTSQLIVLFTSFFSNPPPKHFLSCLLNRVFSSILWKGYPQTHCLIALTLVSLLPVKNMNSGCAFTSHCFWNGFVTTPIFFQRSEKVPGFVASCFWQFKLPSRSGVVPKATLAWCSCRCLFFRAALACTIIKPHSKSDATSCAHFFQK